MHSETATDDGSTLAHGLGMFSLGVVAWAAGSRRPRAQRLVAAAVAIAGLAALAGRRYRGHAQRLRPVTYAITINRPPIDVYAFWRRFDNLPHFMTFLDKVSDAPNGRSHWVAHTGAGRTVSWDAELTEDQPGQLIAWRTIEGSPLIHRGEVSFARTRRNQTRVRATLELGVLGADASPVIVQLLTRRQLKADLRRLQRLLASAPRRALHP